MTALDTFRNPPEVTPFDESTPDFSVVPEGTITDVEGNNAFFQNLWSGGFNTTDIKIYERYISPDDFQYLEISAADGGPFTIATVGNAGSSRNLDITASDQLILSAGALIQLETFTQQPIIFGINGQLVWEFDGNGNLIPLVDLELSIGNLDTNRVIAGYIVNTFTNQVQPIGGGDLLITTSGVPRWRFANDGTFVPDQDGAYSIGSQSNRVADLFLAGQVHFDNLPLQGDGSQASLNGILSRGGSGVGPVNINGSGWLHFHANGADIYVPYWV